jgi:hypothetical protein
MILAFSDGVEDTSNKINNNKIDVPQSNSKLNYSKVEEIIPFDLFGKPNKVELGKFIIWTFILEKPWTQIIYNYDQEYPFRFFIKVKIPSLNDYQTWKHIIPNLDFDSKTGELIIPSKDEAGALAITNLIISNFQGQLSIENILEKNLIPISITKAQQYEMVKNKLREQIIESLQNKLIESKTDYEQDLADNTTTTTTKYNQKPNQKLNQKPNQKQDQDLDDDDDENKTDYEEDLVNNNKITTKESFEHTDPDAYEGTEYTYL